jgi:hypothetical protein
MRSTVSDGCAGRHTKRRTSLFQPSPDILSDHKSVESGRLEFIKWLGVGSYGQAICLRLKKRVVPKKKHSRARGAKPSEEDVSEEIAVKRSIHARDKDSQSEQQFDAEARVYAHSHIAVARFFAAQCILFFQSADKTANLGDGKKEGPYLLLDFRPENVLLDSRGHIMVGVGVVRRPRCLLDIRFRHGTLFGGGAEGHGGRLSLLARDKSG